MRGRGPDLLAGNDIIVADALRRCFERGQIGAGAWLGKTLAPPIVEVRRPRQKALLLLVGAELDQHRADHIDVEDLHVRRRRQHVFLKEHHALHRRPARPTPFLRPAIGRPVARVEDALPAARVFLLRPIAEPHLVADVGWQVIADKAAQLVAKRQFFGAEAKVHGAALPATGRQAPRNTLSTSESPLEPRGQGPGSSREEWAVSALGRAVRRRRRYQEVGPAVRVPSRPGRQRCNRRRAMS